MTEILDNLGDEIIQRVTTSSLAAQLIKEATTFDHVHELANRIIKDQEIIAETFRTYLSGGE